MTEIVRHTSAGEKGRIYSRRQPASNHARTTDPFASENVSDSAISSPLVMPAGVPHPNLLEHLGPAYVATPDGTITWHNDAFLYFARAAWNLTENAEQVTAAPEPLSTVFDTLISTGHFEPARTRAEIGGVARIFRGRHFLGDSSGGVTVYGYFEDITRWITSEQRLAALDDKLTDVIRSTSDWVWETDTDMRLTEVSARIAAITGAPPEAHLGKYVLSLGSLPDPMPGIPDLKLLMQDRRPFRNRLFIMRDETNGYRRIHLSGTPFFDSGNGRFLGYRGTGTDVTRALEAERDAIMARQKLEQALSALELRNEQLRDTLGQAQSASDAKTDFLALTSHELRTPLNAIIGFAELCRRQITDTAGERIPSYLDNILSASGHLVQIIDNLLDTVQIENETTDIDLAELCVADLVRDTVSMIEVRARESEIALVATPAAKDLSVIADKTAARQILINLLTNAIKFTPAGGSVGVEIARGKEDLLYVTIWDTGIGIPMDQQQAVFDRFHRVRSDVFTTTTEGVGIGLHVARNLAQLMGGDITLDSELGRGSRFTLALRLWESTLDQQPANTTGA
ncbi:MAG: PAS domain-containing sensor histidine kinase [Proteobacteria bacterium]|nr:PAS domain-containing sensor histidine kinase [Pseudomonadota bacterium]